MLPGSLLLLHQSFSGWYMSFLIISIEFTHDFVKLVHVKFVIVLGFAESCCLFQHTLLLSSRMCMWLICKIIKLLLKCGNFSLVLSISKLITCYIGVGNRIILSHALGNCSSFSLSLCSCRSFGRWLNNLVRRCNLFCWWCCGLRPFGWTLLSWTWFAIRCYSCFRHCRFAWTCLLGSSTRTFVCLGSSLR